MPARVYDLIRNEFAAWPQRYGWKFVTGSRFWREGKQWYEMQMYRYFPETNEGHAYNFEVELGPHNMEITAESLRPAGDRLSELIAAKLGVPVQARK